MTTTSTADTDIAIVRAGFDAVGRGDLAAFSDLFHSDATWNHRNEDRLGGVHHGSDGIVAFLAEAMQLTAGTLRPVPQSFMADGEGRVVVLTQVSGSRPDGRTFDNPQILLFQLDGDRVRSVDQFVGAPAAVAAFWA